jgi:hypothetical protein
VVGGKCQKILRFFEIAYRRRAWSPLRSTKTGTVLSDIDTQCRFVTCNGLVIGSGHLAESWQVGKGISGVSDFR